MIFLNGVIKVPNAESEIFANRLNILFSCEEQIVPDLHTDQYVCYTCHKYITKHQKPPLCILNNLNISSMPDEINLNELGQTLIARNLLFLKLVNLPRSRWRALKDKIVNVPITDNDLQ
jgi:hypothetical protein